MKKTINIVKESGKVVATLIDVPEAIEVPEVKEVEEPKKKIVDKIKDVIKKPKKD